MKRKKVVIIGLVIISVIIAVVYLISVKKPEEQSSSNYREYKVNFGDITVGIEGVGTVKHNTAIHRFATEGKVLEILVKLGEQVKEGQKIAKLDTDELAERYKREKAEFDKLVIQRNKLQLSKEKVILTADNDAASNANNEQLANDTYTQKYHGFTIQKEEIISQIGQLDHEIRNLENQLNEIKKKIQENQQSSGNSNSNKVTTVSGNSLPNDNVTPPSNENLESQKAVLEEQISSKRSQMKQLEAQMNQANRDQEQLKKEHNIADLNQQIQDKGKIEEKDFTLKDYDLSIRLIQIDINLAQRKLNKLKEVCDDPYLYAKENGFVLSIGTEVGIAITDQTEILKVGNEENVLFEVNVSQTEIGKIDIGQKVELYLEAYPDAPFEGTVEFIQLAPETANSTVNYKVYVTIEGDTQKVYEGMTGEVTFILKQKKDIKTLSNKAITSEHGKQYVSKLNENNELERYEIETGFSDGRVSEIISGIEVDEIVVVER